MPSPSLVDDVVAGYQLAWAERRRLAPLLIPVGAAVLLGSALRHLAFDADPLVVVDGIAQGGDRGEGAWAVLVAAVTLWMTGLIAGAWTLRRGTRPVEAFWHAAKHLPAFAMGVVVVVGAVLVGLWTIAKTSTGTFAVVLVCAVLAVAVGMAARLLLDLIGWAVEGDDRKASWGEGVAFLLAGAGLPLLFAYAGSRLSVAAAPYVSPVAVAVFDAVVGAVLLVVALAGQVGFAAQRYPRDAPQRHPARLWPGIALLAVAVLVPGGWRALHPYAAPSVRTSDRGPGLPVAAAWPAGRQPVIATSSGVWYCENPLCTESTVVDGGPTTMDGVGTVTIGADGTVVKTTVTGGRDRGGPFVNYASCIPEGCRQAWLPIRRTAADKLDPYGSVEAAGAAAPDGSIWLFVAAPVPGGKNGRYRFTMIRCSGVPCTDPQRHEVGTADHPASDQVQYRTSARLSIGADGRPVGLFSDGLSVRRYSCAPVTCADPQTAIMRTTPNAAWDIVGDKVVSVREGELQIGPDAWWKPGDDTPAQSGALAVAGPYVFVAAPQRSGRPQSGFRVTVGDPPTYWRETVQRCRELRCECVPLDRYEGTAQPEVLAVAGDGRVLVVRQDRVVLLEAPFAEPKTRCIEPA